MWEEKIHRRKASRLQQAAHPGHFSVEASGVTSNCRPRSKDQQINNRSGISRGPEKAQGDECISTGCSPTYAMEVINGRATGGRLERSGRIRKPTPLPAK